MDFQQESKSEYFKTTENGKMSIVIRALYVQLWSYRCQNISVLIAEVDYNEDHGCILYQCACPSDAAKINPEQQRSQSSKHNLKLHNIGYIGVRIFLPVHPKRPWVSTIRIT